MRSTTYRAWKFSIALHMGLLGLVALLTWLGRFHKPPKPHVFTLVSPPSMLAPVQTQKPPAVTFPEPVAPKPPTKVELPPPPQSPLQTQPEAQAAVPVKPPLLSYDEFIRLQGKPKPPKASPRPDKAVVPRDIQTESILRELADFESADISADATISPEVLKRYIQALREKIRSQWAKPENWQGHDIAAEVAFTVSAGGQVTGFRIIKGSGIKAFDTSISEVFARVSGLQPPPGGRAHTFSLTFRMQEQ